MKLLRLKIDDPAGFRSLPTGFEHHFRTEWTLQVELAQTDGFAPFVCAGPNGSGKSNLLEALAAIFFQLEIQRVRRSFLPPSFFYDEETNRGGLREGEGSPDAFEIEYLIDLPPELRSPDTSSNQCHVRISKQPGVSPNVEWLNAAEFAFSGEIGDGERAFLLPQFVVGYSSGENEILSLPFFKMRFIQFDEYWNALRTQLPYPGRPETRLTYVDESFSQALLICNFLFQTADALEIFRETVGVEALREFRIIIKRSVEIDAEKVFSFEPEGKPGFENVYEVAKYHPALRVVEDATELSKRFRANVVRLLEKTPGSSENFDPIIERLKRCATCWYEDDESDSLILDYWINEDTRQAFYSNFDRSPVSLFQAFQVLLSLNLYSVSDLLKDELYKSNSLYVNETVPVLASDERVMRFKHFWLKKLGVDEPLLVKSLSDGEHQLLHSVGLCLLFRGTSSLILVDEPETHFNPQWRSSFITRLRDCMRTPENKDLPVPEALVTTHSPFLISDSKPEKVLEFEKTETGVSIKHPEYNTLGASINKITMNTFDKRETIGGYAESILDKFRRRFEAGEDKEALIEEIETTLGDSIEKILLIKTIMDSAEARG